MFVHVAVQSKKQSELVCTLLPFPCLLLPNSNLLFLSCTHVSPKHKLVLIQEMTLLTLYLNHLCRPQLKREGQYLVRTSPVPVSYLQSHKWVNHGPGDSTSLSLPGVHSQHEENGRPANDKSSWNSKHQNHLFKKCATPRTNGWRELNLKQKFWNATNSNKTEKKKISLNQQVRGGSLFCVSEKRANRASLSSVLISRLDGSHSSLDVLVAHVD